MLRVTNSYLFLGSSWQDSSNWHFLTLIVPNLYLIVVKNLRLSLLILACALTSLALNYYVKLVTSNYRHSDIANVPAEPIAIVFGAGIWEDGTPTPMLADRVQAAVDLYKTGRVRQILMTGDNSSPDYNEVKAMQEYA